MSTDCRPLEPIPFSHLFDGRLGTRGISESASESASDGAKCLMDGRSNYLWAYCEEGADSVAVFVRYASCGDPENIISAIEDEFDCRIVTEHQPEYWGFETQDEWDAGHRRPQLEVIPGGKAS